MFDFLLKRSASKLAAPPLSPPTNRDHRAVSMQAQEIARKQADALVGDEPSAADFLLQCEFADVRLKIAEQLHSRAILERIQQAMRNTDRRVAKLMQTRIDALDQLEKQKKAIQHCVTAALALQQATLLTPNQVAELDRLWQQIGEIPTAQQNEFIAVRAALSQRLHDQTALQRGIIDTLAQLHATIAASNNQLPEIMEQTVSALEQQIAVYRTSPEVSALPKHLLTQFDQETQQFKQTLTSLEERHATITARQIALATWEEAQPTSLKVDAINKKWQGFPALNDEVLAPYQERFDTLIQKISEVKKTKEASIHALGQDAKQHFSHTLDAMEAALQDGLLQAAAEHDKTLRAIDHKAAHPSEAQAARLTNARNELNRLQDWAKWGGNISREELIKAVEELASKDLAVTELAKKVGSSRERWRTLDLTSGSAPKALWERFDAACTTAYAPAAAHFKKLADERQQNKVKAQSLIAEVTQYTHTIPTDNDDLSDVDWKEVGGFCQRMSQAWNRLGTVDRKEKKHLDDKFDCVLQKLLEPLRQQRQTEIARREQLINEVMRLNPNERSTLDALRGLQERWQNQAQSLPLDRHDEQALWQRFRNACDALFAKRKESAETADNERRQNLIAKETHCASLEAAQDEPEATIAKLLRESKAAWPSMGQVLRTSEQQNEQRYQTATASLQTKLAVYKRAAIEAQATAMREKLRLCQTVEAAVAQSLPIDTAWTTRWHALPPLATAHEHTMQQRFQAAINALQSGDRSYVKILEKNSPALATQLLRLEIVAGLDSPPALAKERLRMQVEVLQSTLKSGQQSLTPQAQLLHLCSLPALIDTNSIDRIEKLLETISY